MAHEKGARMVGTNPSLPSQFGHLKGMTSGCCGGAGLLSAGCLLCSLSPVLRGHGAHTHLGPEQGLGNEKQQMGVAGKCWLSAWGCRGGEGGRLMMSLNIVSVSVSHSCPFCCAVGKPLPRPVPWEAPSQQRGRSGR